MRVAVLGFSGALGRICLRVLKEEVRKGTVKVEEVLLTSRGSVPRRIPELVEGLPSPKVATVERAEELEGKDWYYGWGEAAVDELSSTSADISFVLVAGIAAVRAALNAVKGARKIALASKEATVFLSRERLFSKKVLPVDSEHFSLGKLLDFVVPSALRRVYITASGGAVLKKGSRKLNRDEVLRHPRWRMGPVITVNSSTMFNKLLEVYESHFLFSLPLHTIEAVIEESATVHAAVELSDSTILFHAYPTTMEVPLRAALLHPHVPQWEGKLPLERVSLKFQRIPRDLFPLYWSGLELLKAEPHRIKTLFVANEVVVESFLRGELDFEEIPRTVLGFEEELNDRGTPPSDPEDLVRYFEEAKRRWECWKR